MVKSLYSLALINYDGLYCFFGIAIKCLYHYTLSACYLVSLHCDISLSLCFVKLVKFTSYNFESNILSLFGQFYKAPVRVNYNSRDVLTCKLLIFTTLD